MHDRIIYQTVIPVVTRYIHQQFLLRDAMHSAVLAIVNMSACLSVYHTRGLCPVSTWFDLRLRFLYLSASAQCRCTEGPAQKA